MGKRVEWQSPLSPAEVKQALAEVTDTQGGIPMFTPRGMGGSGLWKAGSQPLLGTMNLYGFQVQSQPLDSDPCATFCTAKVSAEGTGSRVVARFGFHAAPRLLFFLGFGWAAVISLLIHSPHVTFAMNRTVPALVLLAALGVWLYARARARRDTPALEAFLLQTLRATPAPPRARPPLPAADVDRALAPAGEIPAAIPAAARRKAEAPR